MKKIFPIIILILLLAGVNVKADQYKEGGQSVTKNGTICDQFTNELEGSKTNYTFDQTNGKFTLEGSNYKTANNIVYYKTGKNGRILYTYVLNYNNNSNLPEIKNLNLPAYFCDKTYKTQKESYPISINGVSTPYISSLNTSSYYNKIKISYKASYYLVYGKVTKVGYEIYKSTDNGKTYQNKLTNTTNESYISTGLTMGEKTYYKITPYLIWNNEKKEGEPYYFSATPWINAPSIKATSYNYNTIKITWNKVEGATGYTIYKYNEKTKTYLAINNTKNLYLYTKYQNITGKYSYYKVRSYKIVNNKKVYSVYSNKTYTKPIPSTPSIKVKKYNKTSTKISWNKVEGVNGYLVYRYNSKTKKYVYIKKTKSLYILDKNLKRGKRYYYKVRSYKIVNNKNIYSNYSKVKSIYL